MTLTAERIQELQAEAFQMMEDVVKWTDETYSLPARALEDCIEMYGFRLTSRPLSVLALMNPWEDEIVIASEFAKLLPKGANYFQELTFTKAHELAHAALHALAVLHGEHGQAEEEEANAFATLFLAPQHLLGPFLAAGNSLRDAAEYFCLPEAALRRYALAQ